MNTVKLVRITGSMLLNAVRQQVVAVRLRHNGASSSMWDRVYTPTTRTKLALVKLA
jgi:hypothetical protein